MGRFELIVFDCDGVLVDSERLAVETESKILAELGWPLTTAEIVDRFVGRSEGHMRSEVEAHLGRRVDWEAEFAPHYRSIFERELTTVTGVPEMLAQLDVPDCVASSSSHSSLRFKLSLTGLLERFEGRIFSSEDVAHGKPAPDVFLHAAAEMGADASRCAVVEDSASGVAAGLAAGMAVFAYGGGMTAPDRLRADGVTVFSQMAELPLLLSG